MYAWERERQCFGNAGVTLNQLDGNHILNTIPHLHNYFSTVFIFFID